MAKSYRSRRGAVVLIWFAIAGLFLIGIIGLAIDYAWLNLTEQQLQNAADAASLAAVVLVGEDQDTARTAAIQIAQANQAAGADVLLAANTDNADPDGDIVLGYYDRNTDEFIPRLAGVNAVKVNARRTESSLNGRLGLLFGPVFQVNTAAVQAQAIAIVQGGTGAGLITLNETDDRTLTIGGTSSLTVRDALAPDDYAAIQVNSSHPGAIKINGGPDLLADAINLNASSSNVNEVDGVPVNTGQPRISDPLASIEPPAAGTWPSPLTSQKVSSGHLTPTAQTAGGIPIAYLPGGIKVTNETLTLDSGIYVIEGGLDVNGGVFIADGVMFYVVEGNIILNGNGVIQMSGLDEGYDPYSGISIWQDVSNTESATINGGNQFEEIDGTVYLPGATLDIAGTSDSFGLPQLICDKINITGTGTLSINYDGRYPAPGSRPFLVR